MATITPSPEEMAKRVARFDELQVLETQKNPEVPQDVMDLIYSRKLKPVITLGEDPDSPFGSDAPIVGAAGITMTYAICPAGTGPTLHSHHKTHETFTVMKGRFEIIWGDEGEHSVVLSEFDTISVPPQINRAFRNVSDEEGVLQVVISGGVHDRKDILFPKKTAEQIAEKDADYLKFFREKVGLEFES